MNRFQLSPEAQERLRQRAKAYRGAMGDKARLLRELLDQFADAPTASHRALLQREAHRLCGSAKLYGCDELHDAARACDEALKDEAESERVAQAVEAMLAEMERLAIR